MDVIYQSGGQAIRIVGQDKILADVSSCLAQSGFGYDHDEGPAALVIPEDPGRAELVIIDLTGRWAVDRADGDEARLRKLAAQVPVMAIVDAHSLDRIGSLLDLTGLQFLSWPLVEEEFMAALGGVGFSAGVREQNAELDVDSLAALHEDAERVARTLARLMDDQAAPAQARSGARLPSESARMLREAIRKRRLRNEFFPVEMFADPAWDILLDLAAARHERKQVSVSSVCIAASVPTTTGLRWIKALHNAGLVSRQPDPVDGRRSFIAITESTAALMERYLDVAG